MRKVKASSFGVDHGSRLTDMIAENLAQSGVKEMNRTVISCGCRTTFAVNIQSHFIACGEGTAFNMADVQIYAVCLFCVRDGCRAVFAFDCARIADLSAAFAVEAG